MANKFIITADNKIRLDNVLYHKDLLHYKDELITPVEGGGFYLVDEASKMLFLWGTSSDFGMAKPQEIIKAIENTELTEYKCFDVFYCPRIMSSCPDFEQFRFLIRIPE